MPHLGYLFVFGLLNLCLLSFIDLGLIAEVGLQFVRMKAIVSGTSSHHNHIQIGESRVCPVTKDSKCKAICPSLPDGKVTGHSKLASYVA